MIVNWNNEQAMVEEITCPIRTLITNAELGCEI